ncbi:unnamed protein product [Ambrosiozyma monospora]|uniref:Unnamed protein product n=1 Tax=Ambrosiozyma monospora TaxID=43982 RepID=A0ACB5SW13_AMBMO|nr:unnamed protein product [Ambrosiozyma monospora]
MAGAGACGTEESRFRAGIDAAVTSSKTVAKVTEKNGFNEVKAEPVYMAIDRKKEKSVFEFATDNKVKIIGTSDASTTVDEEKINVAKDRPSEELITADDSKHVDTVTAATANEVYTSSNVMDLNKEVSLTVEENKDCGVVDTSTYTTAEATDAVAVTTTDTNCYGSDSVGSTIAKSVSVHDTGWKNILFNTPMATDVTKDDKNSLSTTDLVVDKDSTDAIVDSVPVPYQDTGWKDVITYDSAVRDKIDAAVDVTDSTGAISSVPGMIKDTELNIIKIANVTIDDASNLDTTNVSKANDSSVYVPALDTADADSDTSTSFTAVRSTDGSTEAAALASESTDVDLADADFSDTVDIVTAPDVHLAKGYPFEPVGIGTAQDVNYVTDHFNQSFVLDSVTVIGYDVEPANVAIDTCPVSKDGEVVEVCEAL